ncbi:hypothetical protein BC833DRAFT_621593 [Globomyces pollinis-pini]|nr:hypothetical protein BC833DRAFT_621593 [Globomyces pollinis-pini]
MAGAAGKKIAEKNRSILQLHKQIYAGIVSFYVLFRILYHWNTFTTFHTVWFIFINVTILLLGWQMKSTADDGGDLSVDGGLLSFFWDVIYIGWIILVTTCYSDKFFWLSILIPLFAAYKIKTIISRFFTGAQKTDVKKKKGPILKYD